MNRCSRISFLGLLTIVACSEVPPPPMTGPGGTGGDGGMTGEAGTSGAGGSDTCAGIVWSRTSLLEDDEVLAGIADGTVSDSSDPVDRWGITTCGGAHDITLTWEEMRQGFDLDLALIASGGGEIAVGTMGAQEETLTRVQLDAGEQFFVEVRAIDTAGVNSLNYTLRVVRSP